MYLRKPNLFVLGAMKSGTKYLSTMLNSHPSIFFCYPEEPSYFVDPEQLRMIWPYMWERGYWKNEREYLQLFASAGEAMVIGEASTNYSKLPFISGVPQRIKNFCPDAKFIYVMRDPVERTISHYWHMVRYHSEYRSMLRAIRTDTQYTDVSHYALQLTAYFDIFGTDRIKILTYEELTSNPLSTIRSLFEWLGVDPLFVPTAINNKVNTTPDVLEKARGLRLLQKFRQPQFWGVIRPYVPSTLKTFLHTRIAVKIVNRSSVDLTEVLKCLRPIQIAQTEELTRLVGRGFPEWTTLYGGDREIQKSATSGWT